MEISCRRPIADLRTPPAPAGFAERWGFGSVKRTVAPVALSAAVALSSLLTPSQASAASRDERSLSAQPKQERTIAERGIAASALRDDATFYILGENHMRVEQQLDALRTMGVAHEKGVRVLAVEIPRAHQAHIDKYRSGKSSLDDLTRQLFERRRDDLPEAYQARMEIIAEAKRLDWEIVAVDGTEDTYWRLGTAEKVAGVDRDFRDPLGEKIVRKKGHHPGISKDRDVAAIEAWQVMLDGRTRDMADGIAEAQRRTGKKVMFVGGANHVSPIASFADAGLRPELRGHISTKGIGALLPEGQAQTIVYLGGKPHAAETGPSRLEAMLAKAGRAGTSRAMEIDLGGHVEVFAVIASN